MATRLAPAIRELRIHICQKGTSSKGVREFIENNYVNIKSANPKLPILIRECSGVQPTLWARFERGKEKCVSLKDLSASDVLNRLENIAK